MGQTSNPSLAWKMDVLKINDDDDDDGSKEHDLDFDDAMSRWTSSRVSSRKALSSEVAGGSLVYHQTRLLLLLLLLKIHKMIISLFSSESKTMECVTEYTLEEKIICIF